jgi:uncharacterized protein DUF4516
LLLFFIFPILKIIVSTFKINFEVIFPELDIDMQNKMNRKFGGGKLATGTPSLGWSCVVVVCSLLGGASIVHNIYKPNLVSFFSSFFFVAHHVFDIMS